MKNKILELIKSSATNENDYKALVSIFNLHEQLQYATNIKQMGEDIFTWLNKEFNIDNVTFSLFDVNKNYKEIILIKGQEFYLDDDLSYFFIINTHTSLNATVSFSATSKVHFKILETKYDIIEAAFFQVSPIIQSGILKKNFIESSSLDSVTNVYNRNYLIENLTTHLRLSNNKQNEIYFLMIGIDHFKAVIDEFDYDIADKVLIELAKVIHTNINEFDMVGRLNGDEFLVSILNNTSEYQAEELAKRIISDFAEISILVNEEKKQSLKKTVCVGFEVYRLHSDITITDCIKNADIALYEAKNKGRSQLFKFSDLSAEDTIDLF
ncbi:GGDEF domain-containing protein [Arcobacter caeni]|jgi:two-component system, cell cycle response regulator|uniref:diguanylate cyclase n=1 Tax=Arcobacter caeni TaxID=1912877 RepID=A0A363CXQ2_9BACT|nr:GGDEF domain-containing protein [Arcobacter caeni]PUE63842.1 GGDEF domain-containing protein [Arcobacter caeni]